VGYTHRALLKELQLWRSLYDDGIVGSRSDLLRFDLIAHGKHELQIFMFPHSSCNGAKDIDPAIHYRAH
jgi:hypothetical protein